MRPRAERLLCAALALLAAAAAAANERLPQPFSATYSVEWRGMTAGTSTLELVRLGIDSYLFRSRNNARGIFRLAIPGTVTQVSTFRVVDGAVMPQSYRADDGSRDTSRDVRLQFDWDAGRITGIAENEQVDEPLEPGTLDSLSVQIALMCALAAGESPTRFRLIDNDEVKEYAYTREGSAQLKTALGELETIIYRAERPGSNRVTRLWLAPRRGYVAVRAEQQRRGKVEFAMNIRDLDGAPLAAANRP